MLEEDVLLNIMSRTMTDAIEKVIKKLQDATGITGSYTIEGEEESQEWLQKLKIEDDKIRLFPNFYAAFTAFNGSNYLILVDHDKSDKEFRIPKYLEELDINSGAWVAIIKELDLPLKKNVDENLKELLDYEWKEDNSRRKKIIFNQKMGRPEFSLAELFYEISLYKITSKFTQAGSLHQLTGCILIKGASYRLLPYSDNVIKEFEDIFENGSKYIPFENILASYVASDFKFAYLDLYRCIEKLESLYFLSELYKKLSLENTDTTLLKFCKNIDESIGLHRLDSHMNLLENLLRSIEIQTKQNPKKIAEKLFKTRNIIAHLSPNQANELHQDALYWNERISSILHLIKILYDTNQNLFEI